MDLLFKRDVTAATIPAILVRHVRNTLTITTLVTATTGAHIQVGLLNGVVSALLLFDLFPRVGIVAICFHSTWRS